MSVSLRTTSNTPIKGPRQADLGQAFLVNASRVEEFVVEESVVHPHATLWDKRGGGQHEGQREGKGEGGDKY